MMLADLPAPSANALMEFLLCLSFIGNIVAVFTTITAGRRTQKREVSFAEEFQPKGDYALKADLIQIESRLAMLMIKGEERAINLHNRINPVVENTAMIKGQMEAFTTSFGNFTQALTALKRDK